MNLDEALKAVARTTFNDGQRVRSNEVYIEATNLLRVMYRNAKESPELTLAVRKVQEAYHWHSAAISNENK